CARRWHYSNYFDYW
nr:immunoglobulin heavy chain junction region [Mus musculus]